MTRKKRISNFISVFILCTIYLTVKSNKTTSAISQSPSSPTLSRVLVASDTISPALDCPPPPTCEGDCAKLLKTITFERDRSNWGNYYYDISKAVESMGFGNGTFVEIGVAYGGLSLAMLEQNPELNVIAIDPFLGGYDGRDIMSDFFKDLPSRYGGTNFSALWAQALASEAGQRFGCRYRLINDLSNVGAREVLDSSVDVVFIDGNHQKEAVRSDINAWRAKLKPARNALFFNDYQPDKWPGVVQAVDEYIASSGLKLFYIGDRDWGNVGISGNLKLRKSNR